MVSIKEFFVGQKLALYEKKQIIDTKSTSIINKIGVIFTTPILNCLIKEMQTLFFISFLYIKLIIDQPLFILIT